MLKRMIGWTMLMVLTGVATARLRGVVDPAIPPGEWHGVLSGLFVVVTWPLLAWSLRALASHLVELLARPRT